jgi:hypothetical protein
VFDRLNGWIHQIASRMCKKEMWIGLNLLGYLYHFFYYLLLRLLCFSRATKYLTLITMSGEFKSLPPAKRNPQLEFRSFLSRVTPNSWYNWLILQNSLFNFDCKLKILFYFLSAIKNRKSSGLKKNIKKIFV